MALTHRGMGPVKLASSLNMHQSTISQLIAGRNSNSRRIDEIAKALGVSTRWLLTGKEDEAPAAFEKNALKQRFLKAMECLPIEQLEHLVSLAEALGQAHKTESVKTASHEAFQKSPLLQSENAAEKRRHRPVQSCVKKASKS
jgi:transcriptional regulator with XRE-family HTH domain